MLFRFFNFCDEAGRRIEPDSRGARVSEGHAKAAERARLQLGDDAKVFRISRIRTKDGEPFMLDRIVVPQALFPGLAEERELPNTLYDHFQRAYGLTVSRGREKLTAVAAGPKEAQALGVAAGTPLLKLDRVMYGLQNQPLEWRISFCRADGAEYVVELR